MLRTRARIAWMVGVLACASACHKDPKTEQLKALETAYQSGVFTKEEYEAKKAALVGAIPAAPVTPSPAAPPSNDPAAAIPDPSAAPPGLSAAAPPDLSAAAQPVTAPAPVPVAPPVAAPAKRPPVVRPPASKPVSRPTASTPPASTPPTAPIPAPPVITATPEPPAVARNDGERTPAVATCSGAEPGGQAIQERYYNASIEAVRRAATVALQGLDFDIKQSSTREMEASKRRHLSAVVGAGGEKVTLRFETTARGTRVTGETKKSFMGKLAQKAWTGAVLSQIACNLRR